MKGQYEVGNTQLCQFFTRLGLASSYFSSTINKCLTNGWNFEKRHIVLQANHLGLKRIKGES